MKGIDKFLQKLDSEAEELEKQMRAVLDKAYLELSGLEQYRIGMRIVTEGGFKGYLHVYRQYQDGPSNSGYYVKYNIGPDRKYVYSILRCDSIDNNSETWFKGGAKDIDDLIDKLGRLIVENLIR